MVQVVFLLADYGHDPTETAVPFSAFVAAGYDVTIATQLGAIPACDARMLTGWTQTFLGADKHTIALYENMKDSSAWQQPRSWCDPSFTLESFDLVFLPGGHDKAVRQLLDCPRAQSLLVSYYPLTRRAYTRENGSRPKFCAAVCHGVQLLAHAKTADGLSVLHDVTTTTLPDFFETSVYATTRLFLGDYYKTYGAGTDNVATIVKASLADSTAQFKSSIDTTRPFVVVDETYHYLSARWPGDAEELAKKTIEAVNSSN
ncbi:class I glutamine amidotransferase-like protein [Phaeosphaeria sp. MPI-PUGE-AT-0046c]|nr:class I glutamine amidotransferase-like protein [Phaeosphaeria sp. MPI-PUGE-AT-0046c]